MSRGRKLIDLCLKTKISDDTRDGESTTYSAETVFPEQAEKKLVKCLKRKITDDTSYGELDEPIFLTQEKMTVEMIPDDSNFPEGIFDIPVVLCNTNNNNNEDEIFYNPEILPSLPVETLEPNSINPTDESNNLLNPIEENTLEPNLSHPTKTRTRKRLADPSSWKININKKLKQKCLPYQSKSGVNRIAKHPKPIECSKCYFKCSNKFSEELRQQLCKQFHILYFQRQKDFLIAFVENFQIERKRAIEGSKKEKKSARKYFLMNNDVKERVCKRFFLSTLSISHGPIDKALENKNDVGVYGVLDQRGRKTPPNKTKPEILDGVKKHIESFPVMESHYCRKDSQRKYLDSNLSIKKMYQLYKDECNRTQKTFVTEITYRRIFCEHYNLSFFKPKKDQCLICTNFEKASEEKKHELQDEFNAHLARKREANNAKELDKIRAASDTSFITATFDLQSVLLIPSGDVSQLYYSRKLNAYNLTVYEGAKPNRAFCYCWSEMNGLRGSSEIGTAIMKWFETLPANVRQVSLFSDTCGGQNRNQHMASLMLFLVNTLPNIDVIEHKFLESGHSHMGADSMHSAIEYAKKYVPVYTMHDWLTIMRMARSNRKNKSNSPYFVEELKFNQFYDLKKLSAKVMINRVTGAEGERVSWLKIKRMKYQKATPNTIWYSYDHSSEYCSLNVDGKKKRPFPSILEKLYKKKIPVNDAKKKKDLKKLCESGVIPQEFHQWYEEIPSIPATTSKRKRERVPEPSMSDDDEEEIEMV